MKPTRKSYPKQNIAGLNLRNAKNSADRRRWLEKLLQLSLPQIGKYSAAEEIASGRNCENMIGVTQVPLGVAGPLRLKSIKFKTEDYYLPLATTEGALVASVNRGCKAISESGGCTVNSQRVGATRGPVFLTGSIRKSQEFELWLKSNLEKLADAAMQTSRHIKLTKYKTASLGKYKFVRFYFDTAEAMGMNMVTIATQKIVDYIEAETQIRCISLAGNYDIDKKASWLNVIDNRGIKVWAEVTISKEVAGQVLKTTPERFYETWVAKCVSGSLISGTIGNNAQAANVIAALYLATGQDLGHIGEGSAAFITTELIKENTGSTGLYISVYLPDVMVGTIGGGTGLATQKEALSVLDCVIGQTGNTKDRLAEIVGAAVLAGEISLISSLSEGTLAKAHMKLARGK